MNYLLHIETATGICSVAVSDGYDLIAMEEEKNGMRHSEIITVQIKRVLEKAGISAGDLKAVSLSEGPGSYTSLRVGMSAAKAISYAMDLPLIAINTLRSLYLASVSEQYGSKVLYCPMIDARRMEVYAGIYNNNGVIFENRPLILDENTFEEFMETNDQVIFSGNGALKVKVLYKGRSYVFTDIECSAVNLIKPAYEKYKNKDFVDMPYFSPNYIKPPNITTPKRILL